MMAADSISTVTNKLSICVRHISEYTRTISRLGESLNTIITQLNINQKADDETRQLRRDTRKCKEKYYKMLSSSSVFVNRFNKLLRFAELDESTKSTLVDSVSKGDYSDFTAYVNQLRHYLDQCNKLYQDYTSTYMDAESHAQSTFGPNRRGSANFESERRINTNAYMEAESHVQGVIATFGPNRRGSTNFVSERRLRHRHTLWPVFTLWSVFRNTLWPVFRNTLWPVFRNNWPVIIGSSFLGGIILYAVNLELFSYIAFGVGLCHYFSNDRLLLVYVLVHY